MKKVMIEITGCEISVEEVDGKCVVTALKDGEVVEEFTIDCSESEGSEDDDFVELEGSEDDELEDDELEDADLNEKVKNFDTFFKNKK